ncbi:MAG: FadD3 family acyl-CoA ligase [Pseudomonadales bacterium]|jgi:acyl-CoA synthetase (AMP-forming)/AMP-acid ligase II|nr:FadD3 family acyl-CoA ligase [Pseudomonadales bacterium]
MNFAELTIPQLVQNAAQQFATRSAIEDGDIRLTYAQLEAERVRAAKAFIAAGIQHGDRIAVWAPNIAEWIIAAIGLQSLGAILVPVNTRMKGAEAGYVLRASNAKLLLTVSGFLGFDYPAMLANETLPDLQNIICLRGESEQSISWQAFLAAGSNVSDADVAARIATVKPSDISDLIFTSGTTGNPKGVKTSHGQNIKVFAVWSELARLDEHDRYLIVNPFFHSFGYKAGWLACLIRGAAMLPMAVFDAKEILVRIGSDKISVLPGPPTLYQTILAFPDLKNYDISNLRLAVTGAAAIPVSLIHQMRNELGFKTVLTAYGLTESCGMVTMCRDGDAAEIIATTSGRAIPDVEVRCVNEQNQEVPRGEAGEIIVRGYNVMQGYFNNDEETAKTIDKDGWMHTGDIGVMDTNGYLKITDRMKDMFIVGGFNCYPAEIENMLATCEGVAQSAVIGIPDERMGEVAMAYIVPKTSSDITAEKVIAWCKQNMANYKVPRRVEIIDAFPLNATGKVMKFVLRDRALGKV